jgi:hypothetical protein
MSSTAYMEIIRESRHTIKSKRWLLSTQEKTPVGPNKAARTEISEIQTVCALSNLPANAPRCFQSLPRVRACPRPISFFKVLKDTRAPKNALNPAAVFLETRP